MFRIILKMDSYMIKIVEREVTFFEASLFDVNCVNLSLFNGLWR